MNAVVLHDTPAARLFIETVIELAAQLEVEENERMQRELGIDANSALAIQEMATRRAAGIRE